MEAVELPPARLAEVREGLTAWMRARAGKFRYSNTRPAKLYPDASGKSDCSGTIWADYAAHGINLADIDMSYEMATGGVHVASGTTVAQFRAIAHKLQPGDIVCMALTTGYGAGTAINHVEQSTGPGLLSWGHGGYPAMGPNLNNLTASWLLPKATRWTVRRYIIAADTPSDDAPTPITESENDMIIIKSPNRPHALVGPGCFHKLRNTEELAVATTVLNPAVKDKLNDRQYDVCRAVILGGALDSTQTRADLAELVAALDKEVA